MFNIRFEILKVTSLTLIILFTITVNLEAQVIISGQVKDAESNLPVEFCTVQVLNKNDSLITSVATNTKGYFNIEINKGTYQLVFSYFSFKNDTSKLQRLSKNIFFGIFKLEKIDTEIGEVIISENKTENKLEKDVVFITKKIKSGSSDTKDILNKIKGIHYNYFSKTLSVDGNDNIAILVNGLQKNVEYIKNISPERIKKVEIIRDPGGRYGIEGYSAVLNVILKNNYKGFEFSINNDVIFDPDAKKTKNILPLNTFYTSFNYTKNKINVYGVISNKYKKLNIITTITKEFASGISENSIMQEQDDYTYKLTSNDYIIGADYYINPKHTISFESNIRAFPFSKNYRQESYNVIKHHNSTELDNFFLETSNKSGTKYFRNTLFYKYVINKKNTLKADFSFSHYTDTYENIYNEISRYKSLENGINVKNNTMFYINFNHKISKKSSLKVGYGNISTNINNSFLIKINKIIVDSLSEKLKYSDFRHQGYSYLSFRPNRNISFKIGGVVETNKPKSENIKNIRYLTYQPYFSFFYKASKKFNFKLKYRTYVAYPSIQQLNPFIYIVDKQTIKKGNLELKPRNIHKVSLKSNLFHNIISIEPYYLFSNNYISKTAILRPDGILEYNYANIGKYNQTGIKTNISFSLGDDFLIQANFKYFKNSLKDVELDNEFFDWTATGQFSYTNEKNDIYAALIYNKLMHKYIKAYGYVKSSDDFWMLMIQKSFYKKKVNVTLGYFLPVNFLVSYNQGYFTRTKNYYSDKVSNIDIMKNFVMITLAYNFNKGKNIRKTNKKIKEEKEKKANE